MKLEAFRERYGQAFYGFINSELGQAMIETLKDSEPTARVTALAPEVQVANSPLFLGQITGWRDCILTLSNLLIVGSEGPKEVEATYEQEDDVERFLKGKPKPEPTIPKTRKKK